jgi:hypothetical protein
MKMDDSKISNNKEQQGVCGGQGWKSALKSLPNPNL